VKPSLFPLGSSSATQRTLSGSFVHRDGGLAHGAPFGKILRWADRTQT